MTSKPTDENREKLRARVTAYNKRTGMGMRFKDEDSKDTPPKTPSLKDAVDRSNAKHGRRVER